MIFKRQILFLFSFFFTQFIIAQGRSTIKAWVDRDQSYIGEPFSLTVEANFPPGSVISFIKIDTIDHFEFADTPVIDTMNSKDGIMIRGLYKLSSFDSGRWVIPSFVLLPGVKTDTIPIDIVFTKNFDPNQEYHDIKDILEVKPAKKKTPWWWYAAGGTLLLILLLVYLLRKKKPATVLAPKMMISPYDEAMQQLERLEKNKPAPKLFHSELTSIFRLYVFRRKGILSLQKTTDGLILQLRSLDLDKAQFDKLSQSLKLSDFVKFAKYIPSNEDDTTAFEEIKNAIVTIEKTEANILPSGKI